MINEKLQNDLLTGIESLTQALHEHKLAAVEHAKADHAYRQAKARAYLMIYTTGEKMTVSHIEAQVDIKCEVEMLACRLAEAHREAAMERVRSLRTEISAMQSIAGAYREETAALRYGQTIG